MCSPATRLRRLPRTSSTASSRPSGWQRVDYAGRVLLELDEEEARKAVRSLSESGAEAIAISLIWCTKHPDHERRLAEIVREEAPEVYVCTSSDVLPRAGEYTRSFTTAVNAFLGPRVSEVTGSIRTALADAGLQHPPLLMQSNGGVARIERAAEHPVSFLLSGPVGGVVGSRVVAEAIGEPNVITTDMGGTSFDVGLVVDGRPLLQPGTFVDGQPIGVPSIAVETVGAGGGSIARVENGVLAVGPGSAGAVPGPACYGLGGELPTVTDADVALGLINPDTFLGGRKRLDREAARRAIDAHVAEPLGISIEDAAEGIKRIVDARMTDLIRQVTVHKGYDPREFALVAFGGAGPVHAYSFGAELGVKKLVVPVTASVHSAFGILTSDLVVTRERSRSFLTPPGSTGAAEHVDAAEVNSILEELERDAVAMLTEQELDVTDLKVERLVDMHFRFQIHELTIAVPNGTLEPADLDELVESFIRDYEQHFGEESAFTAAGVEFVSWRVVVSGNLERPPLTEVGLGDAEQAERLRIDEIYSGGWISARVYDEAALRPGVTLKGPAVVELKDTNIVIGPGQSASVDGHGNLIIVADG